MDFQIRFAPVARAIEGETARGVLWRAARDRFLLDVPDVARYLVGDGAVVTIDRAPCVRDEEVNRFLRMTPLAALYFQRGLLALRSAAAMPPETGRSEGDRPEESGAILIAGDSGAGKSTLLSALLRRGWRMLADDLAVVEMDADGRLMVPPLFPEIILWRDAADKLGLGAETRSDFSNPSGRIIWAPPPAAVPQPLRAIYWLSVHAKAEVESSGLDGKNRFQAIGTLTYNSHIADALLDRAAHFHLASAVAQRTPLIKLKRPRDRWSIDELAAIIVSGDLENPAGR